MARLAADTGLAATPAHWNCGALEDRTIRRFWQNVALWCWLIHCLRAPIRLSKSTITKPNIRHPVTVAGQPCALPWLTCLQIYIYICGSTLRHEGDRLNVDGCPLLMSPVAFLNNYHQKSSVGANCSARLKFAILHFDCHAMEGPRKCVLRGN